MRLSHGDFASRCARRTAVLVSAASLGLVPAASGQTARVYVANSANSRVLSVQFDPMAIFTVIDDANQLTQVRDIAIRDNGLAGSSLIVCDRNGGKIAFYPNSVGIGQILFNKSTMAGPERPDGMSLDLTGNVFVTNSGQGSSGGATQLWVIRRDPGCQGPPCLPGGYRAPLGLIDPNIRIPTQFSGVPTTLAAQLAPETLVAASTSGALTAGDVLVLTDPGALVRYPGAAVGAFLASLAAGQTPAAVAPVALIHPAGASVSADRQFPAGVTPHGMAFGPSGELLVAMSDGRVLIYGADGRRRSNGAGGFVDFTSGSGQDSLKVAVGLQDGKNRAFVTLQQRGEVRRYDFAADGTGALDAIVPGLQYPVGVAASNSSTVPVPAGANVSVAPTTVMTTQIEKVVTAGLINARVSTIADPREAEQSIAAHLTLHRPLLLSELRADLPPIEIPAWARAFRIGDPQTGTPSFILIEAESNVGVAGILEHLAEETPILGYEPDCHDPDFTKQPFMLWSPDENDGPIVEGNTFIDITTGCGSIRGMVREMSYFLAGVRITQPLPDLVAQKLDGIRGVIASPCIQQQLARKLESLLDRAVRDFEHGRYPQSIETLQAIEAKVIQTPQGFSTCGVANTSGDIRARIRSAMFVMGKL